MTAALVGRAHELDAVAAFLDRARETSSALVLKGEAGIGKTAVWREALSLAEADGFRVLRARPSEAEAQLPFGALIDLLGPDLDEAARCLPAPQARVLEAAMLRTEPGETAADQLAVSLGFRGALGELSRASPLVLGIDDLQWLDAPSARVLGFGLRRIEAGEHISLLATRRLEDGAVLADELERALGELDAERLLVGPLSGNALGLLLDDRLGLRLSPPRLELVLERSGGNPLHALELGRAIQAGATLAPGEALPVSSSLAVLVAARVGRLSKLAQALLVELSALSRPSLSAVAGREAELEEVLASGLVEQEGEGLRFAHPLYGSAVYGGATQRRRRAVHAVLAERLEDPEERALHLALATEGTDERVASALEEAATRAAGRGAPDAAAGLFERAAALTDDPGAAARRSLLAAEHHSLSGDGPAARRILEPLVRSLPAGVDRARALVLLSEHDLGQAQSLLEQALTEAGTEPGFRAHVVLALANMIFLFGGSAEEWERHIEDAGALAEEAGDMQLLATALAELAWARFIRGQGVQTDLIERALAGDLTPLPTGGEPPRTKIGCIWMWADRPAAGRPLLAQDLAEAADRGDVATEVTALVHLVELECLAADFRRAEELAERCADLARQLVYGNASPAMLYASALADAYRSHAERARSAARAGSEASREQGDLAFLTQNECVLGLVALSLGQFETAVEHLRPIRSQLAALGVVEPAIVPVLPNLAEALVLPGDLDGAEPLVAELEELGVRLDRAWAVATAARCRALLTAGHGDTGEALAAIEAGWTHHERLGNPFETARTRLVEGTILRRAKRKGAARVALEAALASFEELGTPLWADRARAEIRRLGLRPSRDGGLTDTERKVAELVAAGRTNREVAGELFLSVKTVEANLSRIYRKLGVRSRTELARRL